MKEDIKQKWVAALCSGEYEQGRGFLKHFGEYCCLGVLCDIAAKEGIVSVEEVSGTEENPGVISYDGAWDVLPSSVVEWSGIVTNTGHIPSGVPTYCGTFTNLAELNDLTKLNFDGLADVIEQRF